MSSLHCQLFDRSNSFRVLSPFFTLQSSWLELNSTEGSSSQLKDGGRGRKRDAPADSFTISICTVDGSKKWLKERRKRVSAMNNGIYYGSAWAIIVCPTDLNCCLLYLLFGAKVA